MVARTQSADPSRNEAGNEELGAVREDAKPVDVSNVIATIDRMISPGTAFHTNIAKDSIEGALANVRNKLTDSKSNLTDFRQSSVFAAMSQIWLNPLHNPDKSDCCGAF